MKKSKISLFILIITILTLNFSGCSKKSDKIQFAPTIQEKHNFVYDIISGKQILGTSTFTLEQNGDGYACTVITDLNVMKSESSVIMDKEFKPILMNFELKTDNRNLELTGKFEDKLYIEALDNGTLINKTIKYPKNGIENESLIMVLSQYPLEEGLKFPIMNIVTKNLMVIPTEVEVEKIEKIEVPYGATECYKVKIAFTGTNPHYAYYSVEQRIMYLYDNGSNIFYLKEVY